MPDDLKTPVMLNANMLYKETQRMLEVKVLPDRRVEEKGNKDLVVGSCDATRSCLCIVVQDTAKPTFQTLEKFGWGRIGHWLN